MKNTILDKYYILFNEEMIWCIPPSKLKTRKGEEYFHTNTFSINISPINMYKGDKTYVLKEETNNLATFFEEGFKVAVVEDFDFLAIEGIANNLPAISKGELVPLFNVLRRREVIGLIKPSLDNRPK